MKKQILFLFAFAFIFASTLLGAYEHTGGGVLNLNARGPEINGTSLTATSTDSFYLWYEGAFMPEVKLRIEGGLGFNYAVTFVVDLYKKLKYMNTSFDFYPDIKTVQIFGSWNILDYRAGRHVYTDPSGMLFSQALDGIDIGAKLGPGTLRLETGYTGLVHYLAASQSMTKNDITDRDDSPFVSPRLIESLSYRWPELWKEYINLTGSFIAQQDLLEKDKLAQGTEKLNTFYLHLGLDGFLLPSLGYDAHAIYQMGNYGDNFASGFLASTRFFYFTGWGNTYISLKGIFSSGDKWEDRQDYYGSGISNDTKQFIPITSCGAVGYVEKFNLGNISAAELLISLSKNRKFAAQISGTSIFRSQKGPVSSSLVGDTEKDGSFLGQEVLLDIMGRPSQNLGIGFKAGVLFYGDAVSINELLEDYLPVLFKAGIDLSFSY